MGSLLLSTVRVLLAVQVSQATVGGTVRDEETGDPVSGAVVALFDLDRAVVTDARGRYVLRAVPPGPQHLAIHSIGYEGRTLHAIVPRAGELEINVSLRPAPIPLEDLVVRRRPIVRGAESDVGTDFPDRGMSDAAVRDHPLLAEPDVLQALGGGEVVLSPESPSGVHIRGGASDQTAYLLDGIPVFSPYHAAGVFGAWNPDALSGVRLSAASPSPALPAALSGTIEAVTRTPGARLRTRGSVSSTQARITVDGPLGVAGAAYLLSLRSGFPSLLAPRQDASHLRGETGDRLAKLEAPVPAGRLRFLAYDSENELHAAAIAEAEKAPDPEGEGPGGSNAEDALGPAPGRNVFRWHSRSVGAQWASDFPGLSVRVLGWRAAGDAGALWAAATGATSRMTTARRDVGLLAEVERGAGGTTTAGGVRLEWGRTSYRVQPDTAGGPSWGLTARTPVAAAFARHERPIGPRVELTLGASLTAAAGDVVLGPRARLRWTPGEQWTVSGSYSRSHQYIQSLRNHESVVGKVFPADLYVGAGAAGVPVARSDQVVLAADYRPGAGVRVGVQGYERGLGGLLLVAPRDGEPFATAGFATGSGAARGLAVEAAASGARYGLIASYGLQRVRLVHGDSVYVPEHGATHLIDAGVIVFPSATSSIRLGVSGALGRRSTTAVGGLEWEGCNLLDRGCEFAGSPRTGSEPLGGTALPPYLRVDLGLRKHWHIGLGGRDALIALFGTVTNLFGRRNVLTSALDPATGERVEIGMRPLAPLVVGLDWRF